MKLFVLFSGENLWQRRVRVSPDWSVEKRRRGIYMNDNLGRRMRGESKDNPDAEWPRAAKTTPDLHHDTCQIIKFFPEFQMCDVTDKKGS